MFTASVAKQDELIEALTNGKTVEVAQEEPATASAE
jgi:hypothetical protein